MGLAENTRDGFIAVKADTKAIRIAIGGTATSDASGLNTTATDLVGGINEALAEAQAASGGGVTLAQVQAEVQAAVDGLLDGAPGALDTLNELAAAVNDDASFAASISAQLSAKANSADVYTRTEIGDVTTDFVAVYNAA